MYSKLITIYRDVGWYRCKTQNYKTVTLEKIFDKPQSGEWGADYPKGVGTSVLRTANFTDTGHIDYSNVATRIIGEVKVTKKSYLWWRYTTGIHN